MASLGGRQHPSSPRPSASHTRLSLAGAAGHPRPRRGDRAGRLLPTATLRSQPGLPTVPAPCAGTTGQSLRSGDAGPVCGPRRAHRRARVRVSTWEPAGARGSCPCRPAHGWQRLPVGPFRGPRPSVVEASSSFSHVRVTCEDASLSLSRSSRLRCSRLRFSRHPSEPHLAPGDKRGLPRGPARARRRVLHGRFSQNASPAHLWWRDAGPRAANTCPVADGASGKNRAEGARWSPDQGTKRR